MGQEATCRVEWNGQTSEGKALLETRELRFRGGFRLDIPFDGMQSYEARRGRLSIQFDGGTAVFDLGPLAEKWALKIRYPKSLIDKLGVKAASRTAVLGVADETFHSQLRERTPHITEGRAGKSCDFIFLQVETKQALQKLKSARARLAPTGAIWVVWRKGQPHLTENDVREAGKKAGVVDVKVVAFSETHSALKLVIPVARR